MERRKKIDAIIAEKRLLSADVATSNGSSTTGLRPRRRQRSPPSVVDYSADVFGTTDAAAPGAPPRSVPSAAELFTRVWQSKLGAKCTVSFTPVGLTEHALRQVISRMWADNTWLHRASEWRRVVDFCTRNNFDMATSLDYVVALAAEHRRKTALPSSRLSYVSGMISVAGRMGISMPISRMYQSGLRHSGALVPQHQAPAVSLDQLRRLRDEALTQRNGEQLCAALFLMWKSASRADEVLRLTGDQILQVTRRRVVIYWGGKTKTTIEDPFRPDLYAIVEHNPELPPYVFQACSRMMGNPECYLLQRTTASLNKFLAEALPDAGITCHSIKAGAVDFLMGLVAQKRLEEKYVCLLSKHQTPGATMIKSVTAGYARNKVTLAEVVGTNTASVLLPWW